MCLWHQASCHAETLNPSSSAAALAAATAGKLPFAALLKGCKKPQGDTCGFPPGLASPQWLLSWRAVEASSCWVIQAPAGIAAAAAGAAGAAAATSAVGGAAAVAAAATRLLQHRSLAAQLGCCQLPPGWRGPEERLGKGNSSKPAQHACASCAERRYLTYQKIISCCFCAAQAGYLELFTRGMLPPPKAATPAA